ncbi:MAG: cation:proton antiporter [Saprospiraceae bacterium]|nr:cation:proton antiporter [Saprospiraceae bacterium]
MPDLISIHSLWLSIAFLAGIATKKIGLPPLVGFMMTGIVLNLSGNVSVEVNPLIEVLSEFGILLLLFTIGLKLKVKTLLKPEIFITANLHILITTITIGSFVFGFSYFGLQYFSELNVWSSILIGFALSFSSTVFAIKVLEERGEIQAFHAKIAIGILVIQDILAVIFLSFSSGKMPGLLILGLPIYLYLLSKILSWILDQTGRGELLTLFGLVSTFIAGAYAFELFGLKSSLGALVLGMLLVNHNKSSELYDRIMSYKDFFLIAFFVKIGMTGVINLDVFIVSLILLVFLLFKMGLFLYLLSYFPIKPRTAFLSSSTLTNYSEFALIIGVSGVEMGLLNNDWLLIFAILMSFSFVIASPINSKIHLIFDNNKKRISKIGRRATFIDDDPIIYPDTEVLIVGMGSIGKPAYRYFDQLKKMKTLGLDFDQERVDHLKTQNYHVLYGDAASSELWENIDCTNLQLVLLAMSDFGANLICLHEIIKLKHRNFKICAISHYEDETHTFKSLGVDYIYQYKENIGADFAEQSNFSIINDLKN